MAQIATMEELRAAADAILRDGIVSAFHEAGGNVSQAAALLKTNRQSLYPIMRRLGLEIRVSLQRRP